MGAFLRWRCLFLLIVALTMVLTSPLMEATGLGPRLMLTFLWIVLTGVGGSLIAQTRRWLVAFGLLVFLALLLSAVQAAVPGLPVLRLMETAAAAAILLLILVVVLRYALFGEGVLPLDRVIGAIGGYLVLGLFWARLYVMALVADDHAIVTISNGAPADATDALYYSLVTLSTLGYGDLVAHSDYVRLLSALEAVVGVLYSAVLIASLVAELRMQSRRELKLKS